MLWKHTELHAYGSLLERLQQSSSEMLVHNCELAVGQGRLGGVQNGGDWEVFQDVGGMVPSTDNSC